MFCVNMYARAQGYIPVCTQQCCPLCETKAMASLRLKAKSGSTHQQRKGKERKGKERKGHDTRTAVALAQRKLGFSSTCHTCTVSKHFWNWRRNYNFLSQNTIAWDSACFKPFLAGKACNEVSQNTSNAKMSLRRHCADED